MTLIVSSSRPTRKSQSIIRARAVVGLWYSSVRQALAGMSWWKCSSIVIRRSSSVPYLVSLFIYFCCVLSFINYITSISNRHFTTKAAQWSLGTRISVRVEGKDRRWHHRQQVHRTWRVQRTSVWHDSAECEERHRLGCDVHSQVCILFLNTVLPCWYSISLLAIFIHSQPPSPSNQSTENAPTQTILHLHKSTIVRWVQELKESCSGHFELRWERFEEFQCEFNVQFSLEMTFYRSIVSTF